MTRIGLPRTALCVAAVLVAWSALWAQRDPQEPQESQEPQTVAQRLDAFDERLTTLEKAQTSSVDSPHLPDAALETRLLRIETRVERLESEALRQPTGAAGSGYDRMLESRVRALERQVSRLSR